MYPKRILQITSVLNFGGIETLIMNIFRNIDREKIVFDFLTVSEECGAFEEEILSLGGKIYKIPSIKKSGFLNFKKNLDLFFKEHKEYEIVHSHINAFSSITLEAAKNNGVKTRIAHSHTAFPKYSLIEKIVKNHFKKKITYVATDFFACSTNAAEWLFGKNFKKSIILKNGVDKNKFSFSNSKREKTRKDYNLNQKFVIINVGRFSKEKNHSFLLDIQKEISTQYPDSILVCIGDGKHKNQIIKKIKKLDLEKNVILLPPQKNVYDFLSAADIYVSTSYFEGFGNAVAEAQCNSLPCILSTVHPKEVIISDRCNFLSLDDSPKTWANIIINTYKNSSSIRHYEALIKDDIKQNVDYLSNFYLNK